MKQIMTGAPVCLLLMLFATPAVRPQAQSGSTGFQPPGASAKPTTDQNQPEMTTKDAPALFKARVNLVLVPVVIHDPKGHSIGTFTKENFLLFDKGKPQEITKFSIEKSGSKPAPAPATTITTAGEDPTPPADVPDRFIAYLFDDMHLEFGDLVRSRDAAIRQIGELAKTDRAAVYTTSGQNQVDFTDDVDKLHDTLLKIRNHSISEMGGIAQCPDISYYMADMIINKNDTLALSLAAQEVAGCSGGMGGAGASNYAQAAAMRILSLGSQETRVSLAVMKELVRRMAAMPGQRIIVLVSPGFITPQEQQEKSDIMDRAIHSNVVINSLDARGLWVDPTLDVSKSSRATSPSFMRLKADYDRDSALAQADVLAEMAYGTGGGFFQNNNDLYAGLQRLASAPEFYYILGFAPQNLKLDGSFHSLKVALKAPAPGGMDIQARKGYYAPKKLSNAEETAKEEIEEALFSREEMSELPVELHTQFFKSSAKDATLSVLCRMDPRKIRFRKADGRNYNTLTVVSGIFDRNGNFVSGLQKTVEMRLKDDTLTKLETQGMAIKTTFSVAPGTYLVRLVVRDSEGQLMSAQNSAVAIP